MIQVKVLSESSALNLENKINATLKDFQEKGWHVEGIQYGGLAIGDTHVRLDYNYTAMIIYKLPFKKAD